MTFFIKSLCSIALLLFCVHESGAKEWRGITPLKSTRADVVRILNQCSEHREACVFRLDQGDVYILFSGGLEDEYSDCTRRLPPETVMFIQVEPRSKLKLSDLRLDKKQLRRFGPSPFLDRRGKDYETTDGLVISTYKGRVYQQVYIAAAPTDRLCLAYYEQPEIFIQTLSVHPPISLYVDRPEKITAGTHLVLQANASPHSRRGPTWTISAGKIVSGQHTYKLVVDTTGLHGQTIVIGAELPDSYGHIVGATTTVLVQSN